MAIQVENGKNLIAKGGLSTKEFGYENKEWIGIKKPPGFGGKHRRCRVYMEAGIKRPVTDD